MNWERCEDDQAKCPHCNGTFGDLWEHDFQRREIVNTECPCCGKPISIRRNELVSYDIGTQEPRP
jgi:hypothetical protein